LHTADNCRQVHVAASFTGSQQRALNLNGAGKDGGTAVGNPEAAICVAMKSKLSGGVSSRKSTYYLTDFFRAGAARGVANNNAAYSLTDTLRSHLVKVVKAALVEFAVAFIAVFAPAAIGIHGVFKVYDYFKAVVMETLDGLEGHEQILFRRCFQGFGHIQKPGFDDDNCNRNAPFVANNKLHVAPFLHLGATAARSAEQSQFHGSGVDGRKGTRQVFNELVCAGKAYFSIVDAECGHALKKDNGVGDGDLEVRLLHSVSKTRVKEFDPFRCTFPHLSQLPSEGVSFGKDCPQIEYMRRRSRSRDMAVLLQGGAVH
jgi:hypothetical protein